jgi:CDP-diacylglycerol--glycerol-3-phosphate 3-phosphatidyltransferase
MDAVKRREFLNLPNYISLGRILSIPVLVVIMMLINDARAENHIWNAFWSLVAAVIYAAASLTDMIDGFLARRYKIEGTFGKFFDPLADKILNVGAMIMLIPLGRMPAWFVVILFTREVAITMLRGVAANERLVISASRWGKYKTAFGNFGVSFIILHYPYLGVHWNMVGWALLIISAVFSVGSGVHYVWRFIGELKEQA